MELEVWVPPTSWFDGERRPKLGGRSAAVCTSGPVVGGPDESSGPLVQEPNESNRPFCLRRELAACWAPCLCHSLPTI